MPDEEVQRYASLLLPTTVVPSAEMALASLLKPAPLDGRFPRPWNNGVALLGEKAKLRIRGNPTRIPRFNQWSTVS